MRLLSLVVLVLGCTQQRPVPANQLGELHDTAHHEETDPRVRAQMRARAEDFRHIDELLRAGRLTEATTNAFWLERAHPSAILAKWPAEAARLHDATDELTRAQSLPRALRAEARVGAACGACHARAGATGAFERAHRAPADDGSPGSRMQRHRWATDRIWDGVIGASDYQWRTGLEVFANDLAGHRVHVIATRALSSSQGLQTDHSDVHAELLLACTGCHGND